MDSPPKRRKTGENTAVAVGVSQSLAPREGTRPSGRPSFQSPTRSSLAKSHPDVLERALSRSPTRRPTSRGSQRGRSEQPDPRAVGLRDRKALRPSLGPSSPLKAPRATVDAPTLSPSRRASGIEAFSKPARRLSKKILPGDFTFGSPVRKELAPPEQDTPESQLARELGSATNEPEDEGDADIGIDNPFDDEDPLEPELPPTPTQLGLEKAPDRPMGPLSSSPTARHEKMVKRRTVEHFHPSPLKSLKFQNPSTEESTDDESVVQDELTPAILEKQKLRKSLSAELRSLKDDVEELTKWTEKVESDANLTGNTKALGKFLTLLAEESSHINLPAPRKAPVPVSSLLSTLLPFSANIPRQTRETSPLPTNPFALKESSQSPLYLTVFAPLALRAHITRTLSETSGFTETHTLSFTAPSPFPSSLFNVSVVYETHPETHSLTSLSVPTDNDSKQRKVPECLRQWIDSRLANPLLKLDVATLCWGINRYWEASVSRAQLWAQIEQKHGKETSARGRKDLPGPQDGVITVSELWRLVPHLERSTMVIKTKFSGASTHVLLSNTLVMDDWTGEPQLRPELSVSIPGGNGGSSKKINSEAKKLFHGLLHQEGVGRTKGVAGTVHINTISRATNGALGALFGV
ncbi:Ubiquitin-conjugating enzyme [Penicillium atrosanguineum]|uniref:Ubiquitin-conjugating enzyme n=1 Tax=Penicillium atrosanguineum TaxID=1132637 RepID=UPI002386DDF9|nr:Ubiquitin-conjugating enzyme [Penicillium atrosanguineum]KAJ5300599.1 Ubiquitin-conjugating enzyme [Penicillium atrosanguineum]